MRAAWRRRSCSDWSSEFLPGADVERAEIRDQIASSLQLGRSGAGGPTRCVERLVGDPPGANRVSGGRSRQPELRGAVGIQELALPGPAEHPLARPLGGDLDEEITELAKDRLRNQRAIDSAGGAPRGRNLSGQGDQVVVGNPQLCAARSHPRTWVVEHGGDARARRPGPHRLGFEPNAEGCPQGRDAHRLARTGLAGQNAEALLERQLGLPDDRQIADPQLTKGH